MIQRTDIDRGLSEALANEQQIDVSMIPDISVMALPLEVKRTCLAITKRLQDQGIDDDPLLRLKRTVKVQASMCSITHAQAKAAARVRGKDKRHD